MIYIREAHPQDGRQAPANLRDGFVLNDPQSLEERRKVATDFVSKLKLTLPVLVDTLDDKAKLAFDSWPDRIYVLDAEGKVAYKSGPGPAGFKPDEVPPVLDKLLAGSVILPPTTEASTVPPMLRQRLTRLSTAWELTPEKQEQLLALIARRLSAFQVLQPKRMALARTGDEEKAAASALTEWDAALKAFTREAEACDAALETLLGWKKDPRKQGALTGLGLLGTLPLAPMGAQGQPGRA